MENTADKSNDQTFKYEIIKIEYEFELVQEALTLANNVFMEFEAPECSAEGIKEFQAFTSWDNIASMIDNKEIMFWCCLDQNKVVGVIASKKPCHISLLFVDKEYHRKKIAKNLYQAVTDYYLNHSNHNEVTVNSSPYAVEVYKKLGFVVMDNEQLTNGIRYTPMKHRLERKD